jgi:hypothetical protein
MSDVQRIDSPDQRYFILLASTEMRMSHWVTSAALWVAQPRRLLLEMGGWQWSSDQIAWSADSRLVTIELRRYPGDAPSIVSTLSGRPFFHTHRLRRNRFPLRRSAHF